jgi:hypothetical protein
MSNVSHAAALAATTPIPPTAATFVVLPVALVGGMSIGPVSGWSIGSKWTLPAGTPAGVYRAGYGASDRVTTATLGNPADATNGGFIVCAAGTAVPPIDPRLADFPVDHDRLWPWAFGTPPGKTLAAWLAAPTGNIGSTPFASGLVCIRGTLAGNLVIGGQTVPAGSSGCIALSGATGANCPWSFANQSDWLSNDVLVVGVLA